jgi:Protein of unknown function (DUF2924)
MSMNIADEVAALQKLSVKELQVRYAQVFGEPTRCQNKAWLCKRIIWRLQALAEGDLSERARQRAAELANDANLRLSPPTRAAEEPASKRLVRSAEQPSAEPGSARAPSGRLPLPGTVITRIYKGQTLAVKVLPQGFEHAGQVFASLSAVAKAVTGQHCSGHFFFRIGKQHLGKHGKEPQHVQQS